jgi:dethiobiotin synthetase
MLALFVTGTGTDIGKTFVTAGLIRFFQRKGRAVSALKPIVSGFDPKAPAGSDPAVLLEALGEPVTEQNLARVSFWRFRAPLSPDMASRAEGRSIDFEAVVTLCRAAIPIGDEILLVEGVGGIMVPLDERHTMLDLMARLALPLVLVGGTYLGGLSHLLSAQDVLLRRGLDLAAIVISESEGSTVPLGATLETLSRFTAAPLLGLPRVCAPGRADDAFARLGTSILSHLGSRSV